jgi:hypothetical protein
MADGDSIDADSYRFCRIYIANQHSLARTHAAGYAFLRPLSYYLRR